MDPVEQSTEEFFCSLTKRYNLYDEKGIPYMEGIQSLLLKKATLFELREYLFSNECKKICSVDNDYVIVTKLFSIAEKEQLVGEPSFWYLMDTIEELVVFWTKLNFYLRRIQFDMEISAGTGTAIEENVVSSNDEFWEEFYSFVQSNRVSVLCISECLYGGNYTRPNYVSGRLVKMFINKGDLETAVKMEAFAENYRRKMQQK